MNEYERLIENKADQIELCVELTAVRVAELIAKELDRKQISRGEFARLMEVTPGRVTQILDPDSNPQLRTVAKALAVLGLVMDVNAVPLSSFSSPDKWVETSTEQSFVNTPYAAPGLAQAQAASSASRPSLPEASGTRTG